MNANATKLALWGGVIVLVALVFSPGWALLVLVALILVSALV